MRRFAGALLVVAGLAGCGAAGQRVLAPTVATVAVAPFTNGTGPEALPSMLTEEVRRAFRLDGRLTVVDDPATADALLAGTVVLYDRQPSRFEASQVVREYRMRLGVEATLTGGPAKASLWAARTTGGAPPATGRVERDTVQVVIPATGLAVETEADAQRRLARDVAAEVVRKALEGW